MSASAWRALSLALSLASVLFLPLLAMTSHADEAPAPRFMLNGKDVPEKDFQDFKAKLKGMFDYSCKKTTFGGVNSYRAQDEKGRWYRVREVSGGKQPSSIELDPDQSPSKPE
jgi:hypothetical protein